MPTLGKTAYACLLGRKENWASLASLGVAIPDVFNSETQFIGFVGKSPAAGVAQHAKQSIGAGLKLGFRHNSFGPGLPSKSLATMTHKTSPLSKSGYYSNIFVGHAPRQFDFQNATLQSARDQSFYANRMTHSKSRSNFTTNE